MHGTIGVIGVTNYARNRHGRKRKQRIKLAGGKVVTTVERPVDYRALTAMQPHRRDLPDPLDDKAGTVLGELLLLGRLGQHSFNRATGKYQPSQEARKLYQAGIDFAGLVGAYHAVITSPRGTAGAGRGEDCNGDICQKLVVAAAKGDQRAGEELEQSCKCQSKTRRYDGAYRALLRTTHDPIFGHKVLNVVGRVAVYDELCTDDMLPVLTMGLRALAGHFENGRR